MSSIIFNNVFISQIVNFFHTLEIQQNVDLNEIALPVKKYMLSIDKEVEYLGLIGRNIDNYYYSERELFKILLKSNIRDYLNEKTLLLGKELSKIKAILKVDYLGKERFINRDDLIYKRENINKLCELSKMLTLFMSNSSNEKLNQAIKESTDLLNSHIVWLINCKNENIV